MTTSQFQIVIEMFTQLSKRIEAVRDELKKEMTEGFTHQEAIIQENMHAMGLEFATLETDFQATKQNHEKRLSKLEKRPK